jgi:tetratricopeptide (TPR) repeat protein
MNPWSAGLFLTCVVGCQDGPTPEETADFAASESRWDLVYDALSGAGDEPHILGKRAVAALATGQIGSAIRDWSRLARYDSTRLGEAASGLARSAVAAERAGDQLVLAEAVRALRAVAPEWPVGRLALSLRLPSGRPSADALILAPAILAAAPAREIADDALYALSRAEQERGHCDRAEPMLRTVIRRGDEAIAGHSRRALSDCRLAAGLLAAATGDTLAAVDALNEALDSDPMGLSGRRASVALGDVQEGRGDMFGARLLWQTVVTSGAQRDSITEMALERLNARGTADSIGVSPYQ